MRYMPPEQDTRKHATEEDHAMYDKIMSSSKYKGQHLVIMRGKIVVQEATWEEFVKKIQKYKGMPALQVHVPEKAYFGHPLLGMYYKE